MYDKENLFNKIINKKIESVFLYEDESVIAINDINPSAPVHILVIPKKGFSDINEMIESGDKDLLFKCFEVIKLLAEKYGVKDSFKILTNNGKKAGQVIFHLHFHLLGFK
ncbi:MAG: HIT domain-containing protein [Chlamydiia bacterium]|nr:HIT domain-containing protein [Chlamydiia bacterium]